MSRMSFGRTLSASVLALALLGAGLVHAQQGKRRKRAPARADIMSYGEYARRRHAVPYVLRLSAGSGRLLYFGAKHTRDPNDPQLARMERLWAGFKPDVAFFEGGDPENSPPEVKTREEVRRHGEPSFVIFMATRDKVPVRTLEPSRGDEIALLLKKYSPEEVKVFYVLRQIPQFRGGTHDETVEAYTLNVLGWLSLRPELKGAPRTIAELEASAARLLPRLADWRDVPQAWFDPALAQPPTYLNDVSRLLSEFRDRHMLDLLSGQVSLGKRVFAVVGASHVVMQERALRAAVRVYSPARRR